MWCRLRSLLPHRLYSIYRPYKCSGACEVRLSLSDLSSSPWKHQWAPRSGQDNIFLRGPRFPCKMFARPLCSTRRQHMRSSPPRRIGGHLRRVFDRFEPLVTLLLACCSVLGSRWLLFRNLLDSICSPTRIPRAALPCGKSSPLGTPPHTLRRWILFSSRRTLPHKVRCTTP